MKDKTNWLQRLKDESWEAELLISTVAIFGTIQLFGGIDLLVDIMIDRLSPRQYLIGYGICFGGLLAVSILSTMFIIHFLLRAYWVGLVGLNSVFPDYSIEDSAYSKIYTERILGILPKLEKTIDDVDQLSSVIFSAAFFMLLTYGYLCLIIGLYLLLYNGLLPYVHEYILYFPILLFVGTIALQSFLGIFANMKRFKQVEWIQILLFKVTKLGSMLMLGPLYKYMLQISMSFASNFKKKKAIAGLVVIFILIGLFIAVFQFTDSKMQFLVRGQSYFDSSRTFSEFYATESENNTLLIAPQIDSDVVQSNVLKLFIPLYKHELSRLKDSCPMLQDNNKGKDSRSREDRSKQYLDCYTSYNIVQINDRPTEVEFIKYKHSKTSQFGILGYIESDVFSKGKNIISISKNLKADTLSWEIPFQYYPE